MTWFDGHLDGDPEVLARLANIPPGEPMAASPTGPWIPYDVRNPGAVLAALSTVGSVDSAEGDVPQIVPPLPPGVVGWPAGQDTASLNRT